MSSAGRFQREQESETSTDMDKFEHKTLTTSPESLTYSYYISPDFHEKLNESTPTLMLVHGYPDDAFMWAGAIPRLLQLPYPIIIPDLLGFGGSSKPSDATKYSYLQQANSLAQILDHEKVPNNVIPVGHDWGSATSQRFFLYHRNRCVGLSLLSLAYQPPSPEPFSLEEANKTTAKTFGYPQWEYWNFFCSSDAPKLMSENIQRFWAVNHGNFPSPIPEENGRDIWMREMFCVPGAMREYVTKTGRYANYNVALKPYAENKDLQRRFVDRMSRDGFEGPVNYYHQLKNNTMLEDERKLCERDANGKDKRIIDVPLLYIGQTGDWVCRTDLMKGPQDQGLITDLEEKVVDGGHWILYEKPDEIATLLSEWLTKKFPVGN